MNEFILTMALAVALGWPLGRYMARVMRGDAAPGDRLFAPVERLLYRMLGKTTQGGMSWRGYAGNFLLANAVLGLIVWGLFMAQGVLPLNPDSVPGMQWDLALHTMVSFLTNTNQQHYSGQAQLSYLSQMVGIVGLQVITPMFGLAALVATLRALFGGRETTPLAADSRAADIQAADIQAAEIQTADIQESADRDVGNLWVDITRATLRILLPLCLIWSMLLAWQGVPSTLARGADITPIDASAEMKNPTYSGGPGGADGGGETARHQRRRLVWPQQRGCAGEPHAAVQSAADACDHPDSGRDRIHDRAVHGSAQIRHVRVCDDDDDVVDLDRRRDDGRAHI
jgi:potassium-transporting ATPase potassium-binding subunit